MRNIELLKFSLWGEQNGRKELIDEFQTEDAAVAFARIFYGIYDRVMIYRDGIFDFEYSRRGK